MFNRLNTFISGHVVLNQVPSSIPNETEFIVYQMEPHGMGYAYTIMKSGTLSYLLISSPISLVRDTQWPHNYEEKTELHVNIKNIYGPHKRISSLQTVRAARLRQNCKA